MAPWDSGSRLPIDTDEEEAQEDGAEGVGKAGGAAVPGAAGVPAASSSSAACLVHADRLSSQLIELN